MPREFDTITLPAFWAPALINDDASGLTLDEARECKAAVDKLAIDGWRVVGVVEDSVRQDAGGVTVCNYTITRRV